jgi:hypothetical protein
MRCLLTACLLLIGLPAHAQKHSPPVPLPEQFEIGRLTYFDFGPPLEYFEILVVRPGPNGSSVSRILLTPPANSCHPNAKLETSTDILNLPPAALLANSNPCSISEKDLRRELKRCKHCMNFSGVNVTMRMPCGENSRLIRSDILDKDLFDAAPNTPEHTSWTMQLLARLDQALGPGVMDKPMIDLSDKSQPPAAEFDSTIRAQLESGAFDELFRDEKDKPSELYRSSQTPQQQPSVRLLESTPFQPEVFVEPVYTAIAKLAHVQGMMAFTVQIDEDGKPSLPTFETPHQILEPPILAILPKWKFPKEAAGQTIHIELEFSQNCSSSHDEPNTQ